MKKSTLWQIVAFVQGFLFVVMSTAGFVVFDAKPGWFVVVATVAALVVCYFFAFMKLYSAVRRKSDANAVLKSLSDLQM